MILPTRHTHLEIHVRGTESGSVQATVKDLNTGDRAEPIYFPSTDHLLAALGAYDGKREDTNAGWQWFALVFALVWLAVRCAT